MREKISNLNRANNNLRIPVKEKEEYYWNWVKFKKTLLIILYLHPKNPPNHIIDFSKSGSRWRKICVLGFKENLESCYDVQNIFYL